MQITHWKEKLSVTNVTYDRNKGSALNLYSINKQDDSEINRLVSKKDYEQYWGFPGGSAGRICLQSRKCRKLEFDPSVRKIPWRRKWQPTPVACLENPMDRGAWRATVHRQDHKQTWLKRLSTHTWTIRGTESQKSQQIWKEKTFNYNNKKKCSVKQYYYLPMILVKVKITKRVC